MNMSPYAAPLVTGISSYAETGISSGENEGGWRRGSSVELYLDFRGVEGGSPFPALNEGGSSTEQGSGGDFTC